LIGRLRCGETPADLDEVPAHDLRDLLQSRGTGDLFADLLTRYARYSGVAGVQPKVLVRDNGSLRTHTFSPVDPGERLTAHGTTHIVKSFDPLKFPGLAANEFFCLRAAHAAGLDVAQAELARDGGLLVITRFDLKPDGTYLAFEDGCSLSGRISRDKYEGSYEQLAATLAQVLRGPDGATAELSRFFRSLVLSIAVRNGDAHRKNFGVLYDDASGGVTLAPAFDIITTTPYVPQDSLALTLDGTKRWPDAKRLERFGVQRCRLSPAAAKTIIAEVAEAVSQTARDFSAMSDLDAQVGEIPDKMRSAWTEGVAGLTRTS
jgi:serine/threonine-protein kinase HipA